MFSSISLYNEPVKINSAALIDNIKTHIYEKAEDEYIFVNKKREQFKRYDVVRSCLRIGTITGVHHLSPSLIRRTSIVNLKRSYTPNIMDCLSSKPHATRTDNLRYYMSLGILQHEDKGPGNK